VERGRVAARVVIRIRVEPAALARGGALELRGDEYVYLTRVRRVVAGATVEVFDGGGQAARAVVAAVDLERALLELGPRYQVAAAGPRVTALVPLIKGERFDDCLEKLTEVGVEAIWLYAAERAVVKLEPARLAERTRRWEAVLLAAARQAGRAAPPTLAAPRPLVEVVAAVAPAAWRLVAAVGAEDPPPWPGPDEDAATEVTVLTGPEGGLSPGELGLAVAAGFRPVSLGPWVLRAETAPVVLTSYLQMRARHRP
jgi:16S rRNA (uracil1498-N3)-methyltransferase